MDSACEAKRLLAEEARGGAGPSKLRVSSVGEANTENIGRCATPMNLEPALQLLAGGTSASFSAKAVMARPHLVARCIS